MLRTMAEIRQAILEGTFSALKEAFLEGYRIVPHKVRAAQRARRHSRSGS
jgi:queuine/archaeosine tRNA-ribosyltransferase